MSGPVLQLQLPAEILALIIEYLVSGSPGSPRCPWFYSSLKTLSLTHSAFLGCTRSHLFHTIVIYRPFPDFIAFLRNAPLQLRESIRNLTFYGVRYNSKRGRVPAQKQLSLGAKRLKTLVRCMPLLENLSLEEIALGDATPSTTSRTNTSAESKARRKIVGADVPSLRPQNSFIGDLSLDRLDLSFTFSLHASPVDYLMTLAQFRSIGVLSINNCLWDNEDIQRVDEGLPQLDLTLIRGLGVRRLELSTETLTPMFLRWISHTRSVLGSHDADDEEGGDAADAGRTLREIAVAYKTTQQIEVLGKFLNIAGMTLREVELDLRWLFEGSPFKEDNDTIARYLALSSSCPNLQGLTFQFTTLLFEPGSDISDSDPMKNTIMRLLYSSTSETSLGLHHVTLPIFLRNRRANADTKFALRGILRFLTRFIPHLLSTPSNASSPGLVESIPLSKHTPVQCLNVVFIIPQYSKKDDPNMRDIRSWVDSEMAKDEAEGGMGHYFMEGRVVVDWIEASRRGAL